MSARKIEGKYERTITLKREAINAEARTIELSFSSEAPVTRWYGIEILGHEEGEVNLDRLGSGGHPLLLQHDMDKQIGVIERAWVDKEDKKGRAVARFGRSQLANEVFQDVVDGIRSMVSVGYEVNKSKRLCDDEDEDKTKGYRATLWTPFECSIVSIPADTTVGIGRDAQDTNEEEPKPAPVAEVIEPPQVLATRKVHMAEEIKKDPKQEQLELEEKLARERAAREETEAQEKRLLIKRQTEERVREIYSLAEQFGADSLRQKAMAEDWSVDQFRTALLARMKEDPKSLAKFSDIEMQPQQAMTPGEAFIRSPQYREFGQKMGNKQFQGKFQVELPSWKFGLSTRVGVSPLAVAVAGTGQLGSFLTTTSAVPGVPGLLDQYQLQVSQLFPQAGTTARRISWILEDSYTQVAAARAEAALKALATLDISETSATVESVACYAKITEEMLADVDQIRAYIDGRLSYMVQSKEDDYLINGTGVTPQILGLVNVTGIQTRAAGLSPTVADALGQAMNDIRVTGGVEPDAFIMHPNDWTDLTLSKDTNGQYYAGGPFMNQYGVGPYSNVGRIFGIPVALSPYMTEGTAIVGAFRVGAMIFRKLGLTLTSTNSDGEDFIYNRITIRAESRLTLATFKPKAFCLISGIV